MLLSNYDFYDIYWSIVLMRSHSLKYDYAVSKAIKDVIDTKQKNNTVEMNIIRNILSEVNELKEYEEWQWIQIKNVYTYGVKIIKDDFAYQILSVMFEELLNCLKEPNADRIYDLKTPCIIYLLFLLMKISIVKSELLLKYPFTEENGINTF